MAAHYLTTRSPNVVLYDARAVLAVLIAALAFPQSPVAPIIVATAPVAVSKAVLASD